MNLLAYLPRGPEHALTSPYLCDLTGLSDRALRQELERLVVEERQPIGSGPNGFYLATCPSDLDGPIDNLESRALAILRRRRALRIAQRALDEYSPTLFPLEAVGP